MEIKKNSRKRFVAFSFLSLVFASIMTIAIVGSNFDGFSKINATDTSYSLTLNENNGGGGFASSYSSSVSTNTSAKTKLGNDINIKYANAKKSSGYYVDLKASDGYIYNSNEIYSITSIKVTYTGSTLTFYKSESSSSFPSTGQALTSGQTIELSAGYDFFKIANTGSAASQITKIDLTYTCTPTVKQYEKINSTDELVTGDYLIVYEESATNAIVMDGGANTIDNASSKITNVTINESIIASSSTVDGATFHYDATETTLYSKSGLYIGRTADSNGIHTDSSTKYTNTITISNGAALIKGSGNAVLRYNTTDSRFRYYKSSTYSSQEAVCLYLRSSSSSPITPDPVEPEFDPDSPTVEEFSATINKSNSGLSTSASTSVINREYTLTGTTKLQVSFGVGALNMSNYDEFRLTEGSYLEPQSSCKIYISKISIDYYGSSKNYIDVSANGSTVNGVSSSASAEGSRYDYTINSSTWRILASGGYATMYSVTIYCKVDTGPKSVTGVSLNPTELQLYNEVLQTSATLVATVSPSNAANKNVTWSSSLPGVATVDQNGLVEAVAAGNTTITVRTEDGGFTATCAVTVSLYKHVSSVTLNTTSATVTKGTPVNLTATVLPEDAANKSISWSTDNSNVATVSNGVVSTLSAGVANITVTTVDGSKTATCKVTVNPMPTSGVTLDKTELALKVGGSSTLTATVSPTTADNKAVTWTSNNAAVTIATDPNNDKTVTITGASEGNAVVTVTTTDGGYTATCAVSVTQSTEPIAGDEFELVTSLSDLSEGDYVIFGCKAQSAAAGSFASGGFLNSVITTISDDKITLTDDMKVFSFGKDGTSYTFDTDSGKLGYSGANFTIGTGTLKWGLTISSSGNATITGGSNTVKYNNTAPRFKPYGTSTTNVSTVEIYKKSGSVSSVILDESNVGVNVGSDIQLHHTVLPTTAINKNVDWSSSNSNIATVTEGLVHGVASGIATITVTTVDGNKQASCTVVVQSGSTITPTSVVLNETSKEVSSSDSAFQLEATVYPTNATNKSVNWSSNNTSVATVSSAGLVTPKGSGTATITATTVAGSKTATCTVTVTSFAKTTLLYDYDDYNANNAYAVDNCPLSGSPKLLIIPVWFSDSDDYISTSKKASVRSDIEKAYLGTNTETGWRSVKTFYQEESMNTLNLTGTVTDWYETGTSYTTYGPENSGGNATTSLVTTATNWYFNNNKSDSKSNYDTNHDGYLDGVMLIYAAPDYSALGDDSLSNLWAYCYWLQGSAGTSSSPKPNVFFWASYDFMYGSNASTRTGKSSYYSGDTSHCTIDAHTFIHEMGHVLGAEDYYDYGGQYKPAGAFSMQDYNVGGHDPYSVMAYGWAKPYIPTTTMTITIGDFQSTHDIILLANHTVNSPFDEYLLLELYTPTGLNKFDSDYKYSNCPQGPSAVGIRLWHVDGRLMYSESNDSWSTSLVTDPTHGDVYHAFANSYSGDYVTEYGSSYADYNLLQLIRNNTSTTYKPTDNLSSSSLFKQGDTFTMSTYSKQFVKGAYMNDGSALGWSFTITALSSTSATITVTKL